MVINKEKKRIPGEEYDAVEEEEEAEAKTWLPSCSIPDLNHFQAGSVKINDIFLVYRVFFFLLDKATQ